MTTIEVDNSLLQDDQAETLLASALLSSAMRYELPALLERVSPDDFYDPTFAALWAGARKLSDEGKRISRRTLIAACESVPRRQHVIDSLAGMYVNEAEVPEAATSLIEKSKWRKLIGGLTTGIEHALMAESYDDALQMATDKLRVVSESAGMPLGPKRLSELADEWLEWLQAEPEDSRVFETPWPTLNEVLAGGLHSGRVYVWGGRPGAGKSLAAINVAAYVAEMGHTSLTFSLEMGDREVVSRVVAAGAEAEYGQITKREVDPYNMGKIGLYLDHRVQDAEMYIHDGMNMKIEKMYSIAKQMKASAVGLDVVIIDHIGLAKATDPRVTREQQVAHISRMGKLMAKELDVVVIFAAQLNRGPANEGVPPKISDLRESGAIEQDADVVILLHHEIVEGLRTGDITLIIGKNRTGKNDVQVLLPYRPHYAKLG
ncbi:hypothetical protein CJ179_38795 [Rhodococcus sp. ACS1]|uniref:DnaB-like helicase C-terminal domain-containing protein n=1 Tax=Rhodococcus sp. ACS1 TaxID=2028570 RepID=UPI000BB0D956|nr:DnaB-like helicase C-terminal domain-containing protein [Rhodococcus sp. ACS1]PBC38547.1 hypothetical protein CJ179_38795 [Rhodococcus sp. ACS1]